MGNNKFKNVSVKNHTCFCVDEIIRLEEFGFGKKWWKVMKIYS